MKRSVYNIAEILQILGKQSGAPGKKKFQKIIYLVENLKGVNLGFNYDIHYYGPYSADLDSALVELEAEGLIHYEYEGMSHLICVNPNYARDTGFVPDLSEDEIHSIADLISDYGQKSPAILELLTTTHFVFKQLGAPTSNSVIAGVKKIKGQKYDDIEISNAIGELELPITTVS